MSHRFRALSLAIAAAALTGAAGFAQGAAQAPPMQVPQMFIVHVEHAVPSRLADYEATTKEFISLVQANRSALPNFAFTALQGEDLSYNFITPIRSFADADGILAGFDALAKAVGAEKFGDYMRRSGATFTSTDENAFMEVAGGSYWPAGAAVTPQNAGYYQLDFYYVKPGYEDAAGEVAASWKKLFENGKVPYGYSVFRLALGSDGPLWVVSTPAKDAANLAEINAAAAKAIGAEAWQAQVAKTLAICRGFDSKRYTVRRDLSLPPAGK
ncbi:MAG TPA: hypothetical protein VFS60_04260 [Thermoanaerobaculia bacterium]|nr:hypothetical protein [Thermoanaerobaculia bacterium]